MWWIGTSPKWVKWVKQDNVQKLFLKKYFTKFLSLSLSLWSFVWLSGANEFYKFLIFLISALITFFIFSIYNTVGQQVDQKYVATFSKKILIQTILDLKIMCPHLHYLHDEIRQLIQSCLFNPFNSNKIHFKTTLVSLRFFSYIVTISP